jgi:hypothetical protein
LSFCVELSLAAATATVHAQQITGDSNREHLGVRTFEIADRRVLVEVQHLLKPALSAELLSRPAIVAK